MPGNDENDYFRVYTQDGASSRLDTDISPRSVEGVNTTTSGSGSGSTSVLDVSGSTLSERIENAFGELRDGRGTVTVPQNPDADVWTWGADRVWSPESSLVTAINIEIAPHARIEYNGSGVPLEIDAQGGKATGDTNASRVVGGEWFSTGNHEGMIRVKDENNAEVSPKLIDCTASGSGTFCIQVVNEAWFSESFYMENSALRGPIGLETVPARDNPNSTGDGTNSFDGMHLSTAQVNASEVGLKLFGTFRSAHFDNPQVFAKGDNAICYDIDMDRADGTVFTAPKMEDPAGNNPGTVGIRLNSNHDGFFGPTWVDIKQAQLETKVEDNGATNPYVFHLTNSGYIGFAVEDYGESFSDEQNWHFRPTGELSTAGDVAVRDGTGASTTFTATNDATADSMTANPETDSEDGYFEIVVGGTTYQVPFYSG